MQALNGVSFTIEAGRSLGIVGESGSGKSTLARLVMALDKPTAGSVQLLGRDLHALPREELRAARRDFQMVFQDPYGSLDPRQTVERIVSRAAGGAGRDQPRRAARARRRSAGRVGLRANDLGKYPHEFSGGQRQRIAIARALITRPAPDRGRRAGERARRLGAGAGAEPDAGPAGSSSASPTC